MLRNRKIGLKPIRIPSAEKAHARYNPIPYVVLISVWDLPREEV